MPEPTDETCWSDEDCIRGRHDGVDHRYPSWFADGGERVEQASPAMCATLARKSIADALAELRTANPDLGHVEADLISALAWLPSWMESAWDDRMAAWLDQLNRPADEGGDDRA